MRAFVSPDTRLVGAELEDDQAAIGADPGPRAVAVCLGARASRPRGGWWYPLSGRGAKTSRAPLVSPATRLVAVESNSDQLAVGAERRVVAVGVALAA